MITSNSSNFILPLKYLCILPELNYELIKYLDPLEDYKNLYQNK